MRSPHEVLGVSADATPEQIKSAYRRQARIHHPDRGGKPAAWAELQAAYEQLQPKQAGADALIAQIMGDAVGRAVPWAHGRIDGAAAWAKARIARAVGPGALHRAAGPLLDALVTAAKQEVDHLVGGAADAAAGAVRRGDQIDPDQ